MSKYFITQQELADMHGVKKSYISKLKSQGVFDLCYEGKRLIRDCAIKAFENRPKDPSRDSQREANQKKRKTQPKKETPKIDEQKEIDKFTDDSIKGNEDLYNDQNKDELQSYLRGAKTPNQKVQIIKDFWIGKINEQKYKTEQKKLIYIDEVVKQNQKIIKAIRDKSLSIPSKVAPLVVGMEDIAEVQQIIDDAIYEALSELSRLKIEEV